MEKSARNKKPSPLKVVWGTPPGPGAVVFPCAKHGPTSLLACGMCMKEIQASATGKKPVEELSEVERADRRALAEVFVELARARQVFPAMRSAHEGYAILEEEVDELWAEIKGSQDVVAMREEALQVAAMAVRFLVDVCGPPPSSEK